MPHRTSYVAAIACIAACLLAVPASATHVQCGDVITETTVLDSDLVCANLNDGDVGLTIAASDVTLWMKRHTMRSERGYGTGIVVPDSGYSNIQIRRGNFVGWTRAIDMAASDSQVLKVSVTEPGYPVDLSGSQIRMVGDRNYLATNFVDGFPYRHLPDDDVGIRGMELSGNDVYTWGNTFQEAQGITSTGDQPRHVFNTVETCAEFGGTGIDVRDYTNGAVINRNTVTGCFTDGIAVRASGNVGGALVRLNETHRNGYSGISVADTKAIVGRNNASDNNEVGIISQLAGTTIQNNTANDNGYEGIYAAFGTIDGGGNTAAGNGASPQCVNVQCSSP